MPVDSLGFCWACEGRYLSVQRLRRAVLAEHARRVSEANPDLLSALAPQERRALLEHVAAHAVETGQAGAPALNMDGIEDFLGERAGVGEHERDLWWSEHQ